MRGDSEDLEQTKIGSTGTEELSSLLSLEVSENTDNCSSEESAVHTDSVECPTKMDHAAANKLIVLQQDLVDELADLCADLITKDEAPQVEKDLTRIWDKKNLFRNNVRSFVAPLPAGDSNRVKWEEAGKVMVDKVIAHKREVRGAVESLCPTVKLTDFQQKTLDLQQQTLQESRLAREEREQSYKKAAWAEGTVRLQTFKDEYNGLVAELNSDQTPWGERDNVTITQNMQDLQHWKKTFEKILTNFREFERIVTIHGEQNPHEEILVAAKEEFEAVKELFETAKEKLEAADRERELFSNHKQIGEKLDYPKFSGASHEDFVKFNDKLVRAFRRNGVGKSDQVEKLRKTLSGFALSLVPEITETIEKAFATLKSAFGDPKKVLEDRMKKLKAVGDVPSDKLSKMASQVLESRRNGTL